MDDKTSEKRIDIVNRMIRDRQREIYNEEDELFSKCDVCWTCGMFNVLTYKCVLTYEDAISVVGVEEVNRDSSYFVPIKIKDPVYYRCAGWRERKWKID